ncbi:MAG: sigma-70 family RNA polymerase sigma factor [Bryobacteraceae bacterium]
MPEDSTTLHLLNAWRNGDQQAARQLIARLQPELRRIAAHHMRSERPNHTLQPTAIVNEAFLQMMRGMDIDWRDRAHFLSVASNVLRRILVEYARQAKATKRGGGSPHQAIEDNQPASPASDFDRILDVHNALEELETTDPRSAKIIELRYFGGLTEQETAESMNVSLTTLRRDWQFARAWLAQRLAP